MDYKPLVKSRSEVMTCLRMILQAHDDNKRVLKLDDEQAINKTIDMYDDFYQWLQGRVV